MIQTYGECVYFVAIKGISPQSALAPRWFQPSGWEAFVLPLLNSAEVYQLQAIVPAALPLPLTMQDSLSQ